MPNEQRKPWDSTMRKCLGPFHHRKQLPDSGDPSGTERRKEVAIGENCDKVNDLAADLHSQMATCDFLDDLLITRYPLKAQPWSAARQEIEELQQTMVAAVERTETSLCYLSGSMYELEEWARQARPDLVHDTLLLQKAIDTATLDAIGFKFNLNISKDFVPAARRDGVFVEDRLDVLNGTSPNKLSTDGHLSQDPNPESDKIGAVQAAEAERSLREDYRLHTMSSPVFQGLFQEDLQIETGNAAVMNDLAWLKWRRMEILYRIGRTSAYEAFQSAVLEMLPAAQAVCDRAEAFVTRQQDLRQLYRARARPSQLDEDFDHFQRSAEKKLSRAKTSVFVLQCYVEEGLVQEEAQSAIFTPRWSEESLHDRREVTVLGRFRISLKLPDETISDLITSLKKVDYECELKESVEGHKHQFWYKGLHPLSDDIHAASHQLRDIASANDTYTRAFAKPRFFFSVKVPDAATIESYVERADACYSSTTTLAERVDAKPDLRFEAFDDEIVRVAVGLRDERMRAIRLGPKDVMK